MYFFWTLLGIIFLFMEIKKSNPVKLSMAASFLFLAIVAYKFENVFYIELIALPVFFIVFYCLINIILKREKNELEKMNSLSDCEGKIANVKKDIGKTLSIDGIGYIEYQNKLWQAKSIDDREIKAGSKVEIVSRENLIMNVKAVSYAKK